YFHVTGVQTCALPISIFKIQAKRWGVRKNANAQPSYTLFSFHWKARERIGIADERDGLARMGVGARTRVRVRTRVRARTSFWRRDRKSVGEAEHGGCG